MFFLRLVPVLFLIATLHAQPAPYPPSGLISSVKWDKDSIITFGKGSDQWPITWATDDKTFWMAWSGWPEYDSVSFIKGHFTVK